MSDQQPLFPEPMPPIGDAQPPKATPPVPKEVHIAFAVWVFSALLVTVLQIIDAGDAIADLRKQLAGTPEAADLSADSLKTIYLFAVVMAGLLMLFFAWKMRSGKNWARILLAVFAVVNMMTQASAVGLSEVLPLIGVLITATGLVFMFVPASNVYFAQFRRPPAQPRQQLR